MPRTNGARARRLRWRGEASGSVAQTIIPSGRRRATPIASGPRMRTPSISAWPP